VPDSVGSARRVIVVRLLVTSCHTALDKFRIRWKPNIAPVWNATCFFPTPRAQIVIHGSQSLPTTGLSLSSAKKRDRLSLLSICLSFRLGEQNSSWTRHNSLGSWSSGSFFDCYSNLLFMEKINRVGWTDWMIWTVMALLSRSSSPAVPNQAHSTHVLFRSKLITTSFIRPTRASWVCAQEQEKHCHIHPSHVRRFKLVKLSRTCVIRKSPWFWVNEIDYMYLQPTLQHCHQFQDVRISNSAAWESICKPNNVKIKNARLKFQFENIYTKNLSNDKFVILWFWLWYNGCNINIRISSG